MICFFLVSASLIIQKEIFNDLVHFYVHNFLEPAGHAFLLAPHPSSIGAASQTMFED